MRNENSGHCLGRFFFRFGWEIDRGWFKANPHVKGRVKFLKPFMVLEKQVCQLQLEQRFEDQRVHLLRVQPATCLSNRSTSNRFSLWTNISFTIHRKHIKSFYVNNIYYGKSFEIITPEQKIDIIFNEGFVMEIKFPFKETKLFIPLMEQENVIK